MDPSNDSLWESLLGQPPAERSSKPREQFLREEGPCLDGWLTVEARPARVDWRLSTGPGSSSPTLPVIGPYNELHDSFLQLIQSWQAPRQPIHRLAYGAVLMLPCDGLSAANKALSRLLPSVEIDPDNTRDFMYRINRRCTSRALSGRCEINRLSAWSVIEIARVDIDISSGSSPAVRNALEGTACRLELDVNSVPELDGHISSEEAASLTEELFALAFELAADGDIK